MLGRTFLQFNLNYQRNMITEAKPWFRFADCYLQSLVKPTITDASAETVWLVTDL